MIISTIVIDDEYLASQRLTNLIAETEELKLAGVCSTGKLAIEKINAVQPDLIFLDIDLKDMDGFDILEQIKTEKKPLIIFVTAHDEFALKAFDYFAFDYLLKPFKDERFYKAISNVVNYFKHDEIIHFEDKLNSIIEYVKNNDSTNKQYTDKLSIKLGNKVVFIDAQQIKYITASGYYAEIFTDSNKHLLRESLSNLCDILDPKSFVRIHRSTIININSIAELIHSNYGEIDLKTKDNRVFRISKSYKKEFQKLMGI